MVDIGLKFTPTPAELMRHVAHHEFIRRPIASELFLYHIRLDTAHARTVREAEHLQHSEQSTIHFRRAGALESRHIFVNNFADGAEFAKPVMELQKSRSRL